MDTFNIHGAETHLSRLVDKAAEGEPFVVAEAGEPMVQMVPVDAPPDRPKRRLGSLQGLYNIPDDIDEMGREEIQAMFHGEASG